MASWSRSPARLTTCTCSWPTLRRWQSPSWRTGSKGRTADAVRREFTGVCVRARIRGHLWSPSYVAVSCAGVPLSIIKQYIHGQARPLSTLGPARRHTGWANPGLSPRLAPKNSVKVQAFSRDTTEMDPDNAAVRLALEIKSCSSLIVCSTSQALPSIAVANPCRRGCTATEV
jgi:hypothetical protein